MKNTYVDIFEKDVELYMFALMHAKYAQFVAIFILP